LLLDCKNAWNDISESGIVREIEGVEATR